MKNNRGFAGLLGLLIVAGVIAFVGYQFFLKQRPATQAADAGVPTTMQGLQMAKNLSQICLSETKPYIKVTSPNGGEIFTAGQQITVTWKSCNATEPISIVLMERDPNLKYAYQQSEAPSDISLTLGGFDGNVGTSDTGSLQVTLPSETAHGFIAGQHYYISVSGQDDATIGSWVGASDLSDGLFSILDSAKK